MMKKKKAIILGGSRGIGSHISKELSKLNINLIKCSSKDIDTSNLSDVKKFIAINKSTDILLLNTGGPPAKNYYELSDEDWYKYFNQLFLSFAIILHPLILFLN